MRMSPFLKHGGLALLLSGALGWTATAQTLPATASTPHDLQGPQSPRNLVHFNASASVEVVQDWLSITLSTTREGADASAVQGPLQQALDAALREARPLARPGSLEVRTGHFGLQPRYDRDGRVNGWSGSAELVLEGRDLAALSALATRLRTLAVARVGFSVSRETRARAESEAQQLAIARFRSRADELARGLGFGGYTLRELNISGDEQGGVVQRGQLPMAARAMAMEAAPLPVEAGRSTVLIQVRATVQMH